jgi:hypothetical protein
MAKQAELRKAIDDHLYHIARVQAQLDNAGTFGEAEVLQASLRESKFDLAKLQKELQAAQAAAQAEARAKSLAAYEEKYSGYLQGITNLDKLTDEFMTKLQALEDLFARRYDLTQELTRLYWNQLRNEAKAMGIDPPVAPNQNLHIDGEMQLHVLCLGRNGIISRKLADYPDPFLERSG